MKVFLEKKTAKSPTGELVAIPNGARELAGTQLTEEQMHFVDHTNGTIPEMHAAMLLNALRSDAVKMTEKTLAKLQELWELIGAILEAHDG